MTAMDSRHNEILASMELEPLLFFKKATNVTFLLTTFSKSTRKPPHAHYSSMHSRGSRKEVFLCCCRGN